MSILRKDPVSNGWVIIAEQRSRRPSDFTAPAAESAQADLCPFCAGNESITPPEITAFRSSGEPNTPGWRVRTIPNKFAALGIEGDLDRHADGIYDLMNGIGAHEVIIETPDHGARMTRYSLESLTEILSMYRQRARDLYNDQRLRYVQLFRNYGVRAGANLPHPHSQLIALPITPRWVKEELGCSKAHWESKERCLFCDILRQETRDGSRVVFQNDLFLSFAPFASKFPFETWIMPKRHRAEFKDIADDELGPLAESLRQTLRALERALDDPPYNFIIHSAPRLSPGKYAKAAVSIERDYHWHIEVIPRVTRTAGFEWGTGFYINPIAPEEAADYLRGTLNGAD